jgi:hypothetical protein
VLVCDFDFTDDEMKEAGFNNPEEFAKIIAEDEAMFWGEWQIDVY